MDKLKCTLIKIRIGCVDREVLYRMGVSSQCIEALAVHLISKAIEKDPTPFFHNHTNSLKFRLNIDNRRFEPIERLKCLVRTCTETIRKGLLMRNSNYVPEQCYTCARYNATNSLNPDGTMNLAFICRMTDTFEHPNNNCIDYKMHERYKATLQNCKRNSIK